MSDSIYIQSLEQANPETEGNLEVARSWNGWETGSQN